MQQRDGVRTEAPTHDRARPEVEPAAPFCSIVIPTYNRAPRLKRTVESCLVQDDRDIEVVVVDDGSTDDTEEVVRAFGDPRVRYLYKVNEERAIARNRGVSMARGRYIYFLDSDDLLTPDHISHGRATLERAGWPEVMHSRFEWRFELENRSRLQRYPRDGVSALPRRNFVGSYIWVRRDIALQHPYIEHRDFNVAEDWYLALILTARYPLHFTERATRIVQIHDSRSMAGPPEMFARNLEMMRIHLANDPVVMERFPHLLREVAAELNSIIALQSALYGRPWEAVRQQALAIRGRPALALERRTLAVARHALSAALRRGREASASHG